MKPIPNDLAELSHEVRSLRAQLDRERAEAALRKAEAAEATATREIVEGWRSRVYVFAIAITVVASRTTSRQSDARQRRFSRGHAHCG